MTIQMRPQNKNFLIANPTGIGIAHLHSSRLTQTLTAEKKILKEADIGIFYVPGSCCKFLKIKVKLIRYKKMSFAFKLKIPVFV
jgi:methyl coenzyme M reductase subunit C-like uncharacterized protein (methanogenesis marker protein 7)